MISEHHEQIGLLNWFHRTFPNVLILAVPNGGKRHMSVAIRLKREGLVPGVPDLFIPEWNLWIEMKTVKGRLSEIQKKIIERLENIGHSVIVGRGATDASKQILDYLQKNNVVNR